ncbi:MAG: amino acid ABC transporter permease [Acidimicrobiia bacterium]|nr:amino acid ABC transporter permease [Acidimicrobiia bacterium]
MTAASPPIHRETWIEQVKKNLFRNWWSGLITVVLLPTTGYLAYRAFKFFFINGQWEAVQVNLTLFMQGTFARDEQWRLIAQILIFGLAFGVGLGTASGAAHDRADDAGLVFKRSSLADTLKRMWSLVAFIALLLFFASTDETGNLINPYLVVAGGLGLSFVGYQAFRLPRRLRNLGWLLTMVLLVLGFQVVSGFDAESWVPLSLILGSAAYASVPTEMFDTAATRQAVKVLAALGAVAVVFAIYRVVDAPGIGWDEWSGLHLTLMTSAIAIVLAFPLGLLLALARRSTLPALRLMATTYIEVIRGVPLITLLFMGQFILGFMVPAGTDLSDITRAIAAMTLFTAAYVAEIVRGGLQSLPSGQTEAGQALGLAPPTIMRRIVLPQALRAVIPAMVGQFISLFKDSSLLFIIGITEFLRVRTLVHAQAAFRGVAIAETLVFVAIGYWAFAFAMSRESQRLERRLRVSR